MHIVRHSNGGYSEAIGLTARVDVGCWVSYPQVYPQAVDMYLLTNLLTVRHAVNLLNYKTIDKLYMGMIRCLQIQKIVLHNRVESATSPSPTAHRLHLRRFST
jgi:hypothetical protein